MAAFTLAANDASDGMAHKVTIRNDSITAHSGKTVTLVGTAYNGEALTEVVTGPGTSATVTSTNYFLTLTSATPSATIGADTFDIGWGVDSASAPISVRDRAGTGNSNIGFSCDVTGSPTFTLQQSYGGAWYDNATMTGKSANTQGSLTVPAMAMRMKFSAAGTVDLHLIHHG